MLSRSSNVLADVVRRRAPSVSYRGPFFFLHLLSPPLRPRALLCLRLLLALVVWCARHLLLCLCAAVLCAPCSCSAASASSARVRERSALNLNRAMWCIYSDRIRAQLTNAARTPCQLATPTLPLAPRPASFFFSFTSFSSRSARALLSGTPLFSCAVALGNNECDALFYFDLLLILLSFFDKVGRLVRDVWSRWTHCFTKLAQ